MLNAHLSCLNRKHNWGKAWIESQVTFRKKGSWGCMDELLKGRVCPGGGYRLVAVWIPNLFLYMTLRGKPYLGWTEYSDSLRPITDAATSLTLSSSNSVAAGGKGSCWGWVTSWVAPNNGEFWQGTRLLTHFLILVLWPVVMLGKSFHLRASFSSSVRIDPNNSGDIYSTELFWEATETTYVKHTC